MQVIFNAYSPEDFEAFADFLRQREAARQREKRGELQQAESIKRTYPPHAVAETGSVMSMSGTLGSDTAGFSGVGRRPRY